MSYSIRLGHKLVSRPHCGFVCTSRLLFVLVSRGNSSNSSIERASVSIVVALGMLLLRLEGEGDGVGAAEAAGVDTLEGEVDVEGVVEALSSPYDENAFKSEVNRTCQGHH